MEVSDYVDMGEMHNSFLDNALDKYDDSLTGRLMEVNMAHLRTLGIEPVRLVDMESKIGAEPYLLPPDEFAHGAFYRRGLANGRIAQGEGTVFESLGLLRESGVIGGFSYDLLMKLSNDTMRNFEGSLSNGKLKSNIFGYIQEFDRHGYPSNSGEGGMVGAILAISIASLEWWDQHPEITEPVGSENKAFMAPWVAADVAGAVVGGVSGAVIERSFTGEVNWQSVGAGALVGAATTSTGIVGRFGHWIRRRFTY
jgi:hypothetical protein